jgi:hypothetical protein
LSRLGNLTLSAKLTILSAIVMVAFLAFAAVAYRTMEEVRVKGPVYNDIVESKDLIADVLPPPEYIIESYLVVLQMLDAPDKEVPEMIAKVRDLRDNPTSGYEARHQVWVDSLEEGALRKAMVDDSYLHATRFFNTFEEDFVEAMEKEPPDRIRAREVAVGEMKKHYDNHRKHIDTVVSLSDARFKADEQAADDAVRNGTIALVVLGVLVIAVVIFMAFALARIASGLIEKPPSGSPPAT